MVSSELKLKVEMQNQPRIDLEQHSRNQKVRPVKKSHNTLKIKMLRSPDRKNVHKKQEDTKLYYGLKTEDGGRKTDGREKGNIEYPPQDVLRKESLGLWRTGNFE